MAHYFTNDIVKDAPEEITIHFRDFTYKLNSNAGVFSKDKLDEGTRILLETVLDNESEPESTLDLGCGIGPIALILMEYWKHTAMIMIDVNQRACQLADANMKKYRRKAKILCQSGVNEGQYACILLNPPIRTGKAMIYSLFDQCLEHLKEDGHFWIVMRKQHGAQSAIHYLQEKGYEVEKMARDKGYWVMKISKAGN